MTVIQELARLYERLRAEGKAPPPGYSREKIGGEVVLDAEGNVLAINDLRSLGEKGRLKPRIEAVPAAFKRTSGVKANRLWDKTSYVLGVTAAKDEKGKPLLEDGHPVPLIDDKTRKEHAAFAKAHEALLAGTDDAGLQALLGFIRTWRPEMFTEHGFNPELLDLNLVFRLEGDEVDGKRRFIHQRPAAEALVQKSEEAPRARCLVTGEEAPVARLHPAIKGVAGAQSSGASLVSFNLDAFTSYGKAQGENAPVSETAAFAYGTALNALLAKGSGCNLRIGDTTVVFWAETPERAQASDVEWLMGQALGPPDAAAEANKLAALLHDIAKGRASAPPEFAPDTRIFILGLAPNAARLAIRFWRPGTLGDFARNVLRFWEDLAQDPPAWKGKPAAWSLLYETAAQRKAENIPPRLGGDLMQAVLTGAPYPRTLLAATIGRIRADHDINPRRVALIAAVLRRNFKEDVPMSLDRKNADPAYRLGRLFAVLESIQQAALPGLNATIKDRYFAAASATPARVFPLLVKTATHHLSNLRKGEKGGLAHHFEAEMGEIWSGLEADLPRSLNLEEQGRFIAGYYHQRWARKDTTEALIEDTATEENQPEGASQ